MPFPPQFSLALLNVSIAIRSIHLGLINTWYSASPLLSALTQTARVQTTFEAVDNYMEIFG
ncbi:hypothetical protein ACTXT7_008466 [Hymenolepis weldensis]